MIVTPRLKANVCNDIVKDLTVDGVADIFGRTEPLPVVIKVICPNNNAALAVLESIDRLIDEDDDLRDELDSFGSEFPPDSFEGEVEPIKEIFNENGELDIAATFLQYAKDFAVRKKGTDDSDTGKKKDGD